jgi:hypothetical protein
MDAHRHPGIPCAWPSGRDPRYHNNTSSTPLTFRPCLTNNLRRVIAPEKAVETLCHPMTAAECASNIVRRRSNARKRFEHPCSVLETTLNYVRHSLRCFRSPSKISMYRGQENMPDGPPPWTRPKVCVVYSSHASFKAHSPQSDSLHLNMSIWLVCSAFSSHKSRPLVRVG